MWFGKHARTDPHAAHNCLRQSVAYPVILGEWVDGGVGAQAPFPVFERVSKFEIVIYFHEDTALRMC